MSSGSQARGQLQGATVNNKQAQLGNAYQELGRELGSESLKVVGGYTLGRVIGEGTFGSVHLATHRLTGARCAIKKIPKSATAHLTRELHHHRRLHHPHIVQLHEIVATESHVWLVTELCSGGELFDYLVERGRLTEGEARRLFGELAVAVGWLHRQGVVHRDLKLENVLLDGELHIKLGDLGFAREWQRGRLMETFCGTTGYASPEMLACRKYLGVETDIWSLGVILYTLLCGGLPFDDDDERVMKDLIQEGKYEEPDWLSQEARSLIHDMLQVDPAQRISIEGILSHAWLMLSTQSHRKSCPISDRRAKWAAV
ncbi:kinase-like domain-containing protein [Papiliotrema laurentii]|uniref:Kinase-like domain-containing protein n=1 Tax=Papiliotrema laurentii TaxID=5418 RepID=A0AAD9FTD5_PAPLA|nr:kinase-like domain-containing protein [Papiliotrema laurentii]